MQLAIQRDIAWLVRHAQHRHIGQRMGLDVRTARLGGEGIVGGGELG